MPKSRNRQIIFLIFFGKVTPSLHSLLSPPRSFAALPCPSTPLLPIYFFTSFFTSVFCLSRGFGKGGSLLDLHRFTIPINPHNSSRYPSLARTFFKPPSVCFSQRDVILGLPIRMPILFMLSQPFQEQS
jgi:hypothetical protein